jgi:hypothetical protein
MELLWQLYVFVACVVLQTETNGRTYWGLHVEELAQDAEVPRCNAKLTDAKAYSRLVSDDDDQKLSTA